ncbi:MAG: glycosyltransferase, partial [Symploca sp. SIO2B6]|nr:glycosyltransferase [Symploca sp. SIO2B6]
MHVSPPTISIILPSYNGDRYLAQAIDSVLSQTYQDYELLVIDDGSTDTTPTLVQSYTHRKPFRLSQKLRYIRQSNQGVSAARNHGIQLARGEIIAFLDADDWFLPLKLEQQYAVFAAEPTAGLVHSGWRRVNAEGAPLMDVTPWHDCPQLDLEQWLKWKPVLPSAMMFRKEWLLRADGFDPHFPLAEDTDLTLRLAAMGCQTAWLDL